LRAFRASFTHKVRFFNNVNDFIYLEQQYTIEWQRRIFRKIGEYLRRNNITVQKCFNLIDEDSSQTISIEELKAALIRFQINLSDKEIKVFLQKLDEDKKGYISQSQFMKKFWAAYTYDDLFNADDSAASRGTMIA
jgi:Ca2+-binding EF-hand superfamily protein